MTNPIDTTDVVSATTTSEQDRKTAGQRAINMIWETTQMRVALSVIWSSLLVAGILAVLGKWLGSPDLQLAAIVFLFGVANLVTGFYFGRTNHTRSSGGGDGNTPRDTR
jgi:small basic protein